MICLRDKSFCVIESKEHIAKLLGEGEYEKLVPGILWLNENKVSPDFILGKKKIYNLSGERLKYDNLKNFKEYTRGVEGFWNEFIITKDSQGTRVFCVLHFGANGPGEWIKKDLKDAKKEYEKLIANGAKDVSFTVAHRDLADDVSDWGTTFTI